MPKKCPQCQSVQPDALEFCPADGARLIVPPPPDGQAPRASPLAQGRANRETGRRFPSTLMGMPAGDAGPRLPGMSAGAAAGADAPSAPTGENEATRFYDASEFLSRLDAPPAAAAAAAAAAPAPAPAAAAAVDLPAAGGSTLRDLLAKGPLATEPAVARIAAVADVVATAGRAPGTLTPAHVRYAGADAGGQPGLTEAGELDAMYAATYRAPELDQGPATAAADVYALGCLLFEAVTGKAPIRGKTPAEIQKRHATAAAPAARQIRVDCDLPPALEVEIQRSLRKRPGDRHPTVKAFAAAIRATMKDDDRSTMALGGDEAAFLKSLLAGDDVPVRAGHTAPSPAAARPSVSRPLPSIGPAPSSPSGSRPAAHAPAAPASRPPAAPAAMPGRQGMAPAPQPAVAEAPRAARSAPTDAVAGKQKSKGVWIGVVAAAGVLVVGAGIVLLLQGDLPPPVAEPAAKVVPPVPVEVAAEAPPVPDSPDVQAAPVEEDVQVAVEAPDAGPQEDIAVAAPARKPSQGKKPPKVPTVTGDPVPPKPPKPKDGPAVF